MEIMAHTGIVRVLHDSHKLDHIVSKIPNPWQNVLGKLFICANSALGGGDPDVSLVYSDIVCFLWTRIFECISFRNGGIPEPSVVYRRDIEVLRNTANPCR